MSCVTGSFLLKNDAHYGCSSKHHGVDLDQASRLFGIIRELDNKTIQELVYKKYRFYEILLCLKLQQIYYSFLRYLLA